MRALLVIVSMAAAACGHTSGDGDKPKPRTKIGRAKETVCKPDREPGSAQPGVNGLCQKDEDCTSGKNGRCQRMGNRMPENGCTYDACFKDADCTTGGPCQCDAYRGNYCLAGACRTNADCGPDGSCGPSNSFGCGSGGTAVYYYCRTAKDTCSSDDDCTKTEACTYSSQAGHWACEERSPCPPG